MPQPHLRKLAKFNRRIAALNHLLEVQAGDKEVRNSLTGLTSISLLREEISIAEKERDDFLQGIEEQRLREERYRRERTLREKSPVSVIFLGETTYLQPRELELELELELERELEKKKGGE